MKNELEQTQSKYQEVPQELTVRNNWVNWRYETRKDKAGNEKQTKVPYQATSGMSKASTTNPQTWRSFSQAESNEERFDGIGYVLCDGIAGIDVDDEYEVDQEDKPIPDWLTPWIGKSYMEYSPSGTGLKVVFAHNGYRPPYMGEDQDGKNNQTEKIEAYYNKRYFTITGQAVSVPDGQLTDYKEDGNKLLETVFRKIASEFFEKPKENKDRKQVTALTSLSDQSVVTKASNNPTQGAKFNALYNGSSGGNPSEDDYSLLGILVYWCNADEDQMRSVFESSALYRPEKGKDYLDRSIKKVIKKHLDNGGRLYQDDVKVEITPPVPQTKPQEEVEVVAGVDVDNEPEEDLDILPEILTNNSDLNNRKANRIADDAMAVLEKANPNEAKIFVKEGVFGMIEEVTRNKRIDPDTIVPITKPEFKAFSVNSLTGVLNEHMTFIKKVKAQVKQTVPDGEDKDGNPKTKEVKFDSTKDRTLMAPQAPIVNHVLYNQSKNNIPYLQMIVSHPILNRAFEIINTPGYHPEDQIYMDASKTVEIEDLKIEDAWEAILDWLGDFEFKDESDAANALGLLLTPLIRPALPEGELPPLFAITSNSQGAGKSVLAQILATVTLGQAPGSSQLPDNDEEIRKQLNSELMRGGEVIVLDNIKEQSTVASSALASAVSESVITFRPLGGNEIKSIENTATYVMTGNNIATDADLTDRSCWIRLEIEERAADRVFKTETILTDTLKDRPKLFSAIIKFINVWIEDGMKVDGQVKHRSRYWAKLIKSIFDSVSRRLKKEEDDECVLDEFLKNDTESRKESNPEFKAMCDFRDVVLSEFPIDPETNKTERFHCKDVASFGTFRQNHDGQDLDLLGPWFKDGGGRAYHEKNRTSALTYYLRSMKDKVFGGYKLIVDEQKKQNRVAFRFVLKGVNNEVDSQSEGELPF